MKLWISRVSVKYSNVRFLKQFSTSTSSSPDWKTQVTLFQLTSQISSILLQRHDWITHLKDIKPKLPKSTLTPPIFLNILQETRQQPNTTLEFFNWAQTHLRFKPDLKSHCRVIELATESGLLEQARALLCPVLETYSVSIIVDSMHRWFRDEDSLSVSLSLVIECCACYKNGLEVFGLMKRLRLLPLVNGYNSLLDSLVKEKEFRAALCLYSVMIRDGVVSDELTCDLVCEVLCKLGKSKSVVNLMETGVGSCKIYSNLVECYSRNGDFDSVFSLIREKRLELSFCSYGCVLDDACRLGDGVDKVLGLMVEKKVLTLDDSVVIERFCDMGRTFAAEMLFRRASRLRDETYGVMLKALSRKERTKEAVELYRLICRKGVMVLDESCYTEFANALCRDGNGSEEEEELLLVDVIRRGFVPCTVKLSEKLASLCRERRWNQAEKLLDSVMEMEVYFDSFSCGLLMERYCRTGKLEKAIELHEKIKKMKGSLDASTYNTVLEQLMMRQRERVEEAVGVFEYMKEMNTVNTKSFIVMINALCRVKEMKKAMRAHDEMLKMDMKPDLATYKHVIGLITGFK